MILCLDHLLKNSQILKRNPLSAKIPISFVSSHLLMSSVSKNYSKLTRINLLLSPFVSHFMKGFGPGPTLRRRSTLIHGISLTVHRKPSVKLIFSEVSAMLR